MVITLVLTADAQGSELKESWYMDRGKANMEIKHYKAAIEAFEKLIELNPDNREAMRLLGLAYELQGLTDKAIMHYDRYLNQFPDDAEIAFKQARYLEGSRYAYRKKDVIKYYRMGLRAQEHHENRHKLAKLLSANKNTIDEAIKEYKILMKKDPRNPAIREEYRKLLLWDDRYLSEAIQEYEKVAKAHPEQFEVNHQLAKLYYKDDRLTLKAIKQYRKLISKRPHNVSLRKEYAKALAKSNRHFDEANKQFLMVLKQKDDFATHLAYADHLAKRETTRDEALARYEQLVKEYPNKTEVRLKYARLLSARIETIDLAIEQYEAVLETDSKNSVAHRELAQAYAWKGDNDQAIYHSKFALKYNSQDTTASALKADLMQGREPSILAGFTYLDQSGDERNWDYSGYILKAGGKADLTPFLTSSLDIGRETYENDEPDIEGTFYKLVLQYRFDPTRRFDASWTYHDFDESENKNEFSIQYSFQKGDFGITPGFKREIKYDSLLSIAGDTDEFTQRRIGSALSNILFCKFLYQEGRFQGAVLPFVGYVSAESTTNNELVGADADARYHFINDRAFLFSTLYKFQIYHYQKDQSGFVFSDTEPFAGGYFSPQLFLNNVLKLEFGYQFQNEAVLRVEAGPSFQYTNDSSNDVTWDIGGDVHLSYQMPLERSLYLNTEGNYFQIADVYRRYNISASIAYRF